VLGEARTASTPAADLAVVPAFGTDSLCVLYQSSVLSRRVTDFLRVLQTATDRVAPLHRAPCFRFSWTLPLRPRRAVSTSTDIGSYALRGPPLPAPPRCPLRSPVALVKLLLEHLANFALVSTVKATTRQLVLTDVLPTSLARLESSLQESVSSLSPKENGIGSLLKSEKKRKASLGTPSETRCADDSLNSHLGLC